MLKKMFNFLLEKVSIVKNKINKVGKICKQEFISLIKISKINLNTLKDFLKVLKGQLDNSIPDKAPSIIIDLKIHRIIIEYKVQMQVEELLSNNWLNILSDKYIKFTIKNYFSLLKKNIHQIHFVMIIGDDLRQVSTLQCTYNNSIDCLEIMKQALVYLVERYNDDEIKGLVFYITKINLAEPDIFDKMLKVFDKFL